MDIKEYIDSGILELYVAGALSEKESREVYEIMLKHPEVLTEVQNIEDAIVKLTAATSPSDSKLLYNTIKDKIGFTGNEPKVITITKTNWISYTGWAAAIVLGFGLLWTLNQNNQLESKLTTADIENAYLESQIEASKTSLAATQNLLNILRDKDIIAIPLDGQTVYPEAYAKVYWNKNTNNIYLDAQGLPPAPKGKVYQVWSLTLNPLIPTSLGTIDDFNTDENKIFAIENTNASQAFGITLEPAGGSLSPTMDQLYTLGIVTASS